MAKGDIIRINNPGTHGTISRTDDGTGDYYQFRIPQDCLAGYVPVLNDKTDFTPITDTAQRAESVKKDVPLFEIQSFTVVANGDSSHTLTWLTTGASTGKIRYTKQDGTTRDIDISARVNSGTETIPAADTAKADPVNKCYTILVFDAASNVLNRTACV